MKPLLLVTALIELGAGLALLAFPSAAVTLLLGVPLEATASLVVARLGGAGLLTLGVACWFAHYDAQSCAARGLTSAMVLYNLGAVVIFSVAGIQLQTIGIALWPAVALHAAMTAWCVTGLLRTPSAKQ
jgi:hypothetical protein